VKKSSILQKVIAGEESSFSSKVNIGSKSYILLIREQFGIKRVQNIRSRFKRSSSIRRFTQAIND